MGWSQDDVIAALARKRIKVNHRRLTDWRQKGLLPDMEEVRDVHGHVAYVWNQASIVNQVETISELFAYYGRVNRFAHVLWLLGYEVRPTLVMEGMRAPIESMWLFWSGGARDSEDILWNISMLAIKMMWRRERRPTGFPDREQAAEQMERFMSAFADPDYPTEKLIGELATQASSTRSTTLFDAASNVKMVHTLKVFQHHLTLPILADVASTASWEELSEAREDFGLLRDICAPCAEVVRIRSGVGETESRLWTVLRNGALSAFGPWIVVIDVALRRAGYGRRIRTYLRLARRQVGAPDFLMKMVEELDAQVTLAGDTPSGENTEQ